MKEKTCLELAKPLKLSGNTNKYWQYCISFYEHLQNLENWVQIQSHRLSSVFPKLLFWHPGDYAHFNCFCFNWLKSLQNHQEFAAATSLHRHICHIAEEHLFLYLCILLSFIPFKFLLNNINNNINISFYFGFLNGPIEIFNSDVINNPVKLSHDWMFSCISNKIPIPIANTLLFKLFKTLFRQFKITNEV